MLQRPLLECPEYRRKITVAPQLLIVISTYNERQSLPSLVEEIWRYLPQAKVLVVDDNSPDGTGQWVTQRSESEPRIELLHRDSKQGLGVATISGIKLALTQNPDWIGTMDADLSHRPKDLAKMWEAAQTECADVIIGSRYTSGGSITNWSLSRRLASRGVNFFARWVLWLTTRDNSSALRIYRGNTLKQLDLSQVDCRGYAYLEQILLHLRRAGARFQEIPIEFSDRVDGESKVSVAEVFRNLRDILYLAVRRT